MLKKDRGVKCQPTLWRSMGKALLGELSTPKTMIYFSSMLSSLLHPDLALPDMLAAGGMMAFRAAMVRASEPAIFDGKRTGTVLPQSLSGRYGNRDYIYVTESAYSAFALCALSKAAHASYKAIGLI